MDKHRKTREASATLWNMAAICSTIPILWETTLHFAVWFPKFGLTRCKMREAPNRIKTYLSILLINLILTNDP